MKNLSRTRIRQTQGRSTLQRKGTARSRGGRLLDRGGKTPAQIIPSITISRGATKSMTGGTNRTTRSEQFEGVRRFEWGGGHFKSPPEGRGIRVPSRLHGGDTNGRKRGSGGVGKWAKQGGGTPDLGTAPPDKPPVAVGERLKGWETMGKGKKKEKWGKKGHQRTRGFGTFRTRKQPTANRCGKKCGKARGQNNLRVHCRQGKERTGGETSNNGRTGKGTMGQNHRPTRRGRCHLPWVIIKNKADSPLQGKRVGVVSVKIHVGGAVKAPGQHYARGLVARKRTPAASVPAGLKGKGLIPKKTSKYERRRGMLQLEARKRGGTKLERASGQGLSQKKKGGRSPKPSRTKKKHQKRQKPGQPQGGGSREGGGKNWGTTNLSLVYLRKGRASCCCTERRPAPRKRFGALELRESRKRESKKKNTPGLGRPYPVPPEGAAGCHRPQQKNQHSFDFGSVQP